MILFVEVTPERVIALCASPVELHALVAPAATVGAAHVRLAAAAQCGQLADWGRATELVQAAGIIGERHRAVRLLREAFGDRLEVRGLGKARRYRVAPSLLALTGAAWAACTELLRTPEVAC